MNPNAGEWKPKWATTTTPTTTTSADSNANNTNNTSASLLRPAQLQFNPPAASKPAAPVASTAADVKTPFVKAPVEFGSTAPVASTAADVKTPFVKAPVEFGSTAPTKTATTTETPKAETTSAPPPTVVVAAKVESKSAPPVKKETAPPPPSAKEEEDADEGDAISRKPAAELTDGDSREHLNVVFIGHVDAGKSTLSGSILFEMNVVDKRTIEKYQREAKEQNRESWFLAYIMDTNEEERAKGKTVEIGKATFETSVKRYTILDAPGHKNYVPAMISGACQGDVAVLVISARKGEFEAGFEKLGQTREHALLAFTLGVRKLVVAINKMDDPTVNWSQERYDEIQKKVLPFLRSMGFKVKKDVYFIPIAALSGQNIRNRLNHSALGCVWAKNIADGMSLIELLDSLEISHRDPTANLRLPVLYTYFDRGVNILGKVEFGTLTLGMKVHVNPTKIISEVDSIIIGDSTEVRSAKPGENVQIRLKGLGEGDCQKGYVIAQQPLGCTQFTATLKILELLEHRPIFSAGYHSILHVHTAVEECRIEKILWGHDTETGKPIKKPKTFAKSGELVTCRIVVNQKLCIETSKENAVLGRITLRDEGKTIAIGKIMKLEDDQNQATRTVAKSAVGPGSKAVTADDNDDDE